MPLASLCTLPRSLHPAPQVLLFGATCLRQLLTAGCPALTDGVDCSDAIVVLHACTGRTTTVKTFNQVPAWILPKEACARDGVADLLQASEWLCCPLAVQFASAIAPVELVKLSSPGRAGV